VNVRLWSTLCCPSHEYACELWEGEIPDHWERKLESSKFSRFAVGIHGTPSAAGLHSELRLRTLKSRSIQLKLGFWKRLCKADSSRLFSLVFRSRHEQVKVGNARSSSLWAMKHLLESCGWETIGKAAADL
jgi:hypothetical protein